MVRFLCALLFLSLAAACGQSGAEDKTVQVAENDVAMNKAMNRARASLTEFLILAEKPAPNTSSYALKVQIEDQYGVEHFWVTPFTQTATGFKGVISNKPAVVRKVREGQSYEFTREEVSDWMFMKDGKIHGGHTIRALIPTLPPKEAAQYREMLADF